MAKQYKVCVLGATGAVGRTILTILAERKFPVDTLYPLASHRSAGQSIEFGGKKLTVLDVDKFDFSQADIGLFSPGGAVSAKFAPIAAAAGCIVIDNTSQFRYEETVPLVVPEVNPEDLARYSERNIIANPNCSTIQMVVALKPIMDAVGITRINVATYQAVSGSGKKGVDELQRQAEQHCQGQALSTEQYPVPIAFNVIPQIDSFQDNGYTREEMKMVWETRKLFHAPDLAINPTAVRVPVMMGHSEAVHLETREPISASQARSLLAQAPGVEVMDEPIEGGYPTPRRQGQGTDKVYVGRIRADISHPKGLNLWIVADNVRKGAALNAVQIAEQLCQRYLK